VILAVFPIITVTSVWGFALKIGLVIVLTNLLGIGILASSRRESRRDGPLSRSAS
jgi:hypothetical protein